MQIKRIHSGIGIIYTRKIETFHITTIIKRWNERTFFFSFTEISVKKTPKMLSFSILLINWMKLQAGKLQYSKFSCLTVDLNFISLNYSRGITKNKRFFFFFTCKIVDGFSVNDAEFSTKFRFGFFDTWILSTLLKRNFHQSNI